VVTGGVKKANFWNHGKNRRDTEKVEKEHGKHDWKKAQLNIFNKVRKGGRSTQI